jgi:hypothetical protein
MLFQQAEYLSHKGFHVLVLIHHMQVSGIGRFRAPRAVNSNCLHFHPPAFQNMPGELKSAKTAQASRLTGSQQHQSDAGHQEDDFPEGNLSGQAGNPDGAYHQQDERTDAANEGIYPDSLAQIIEPEDQYTADKAKDSVHHPDDRHC